MEFNFYGPAINLERCQEQESRKKIHSLSLITISGLLDSIILMYMSTVEDQMATHFPRRYHFILIIVLLHFPSKDL